MIPCETMLDRIVASDAACVGDRLGVILARPNNPFGAAVLRDGAVHGFRRAGIPTVPFNRVIGLSEGCDPVWSRAAAFSASARNLWRAGFSPLCDLALWRPLAP